MVDNGFDPEFAAASDWARLYRANGVQIVPCKNKIPRLKSWKEYQNALVPDAQFEAWYGHDGEFAQSYDMGMLTGTASGRILMIDLDYYKPGGDRAKQWWGSVLLTHNNGMILETWQQRTGGGGIQLFFSYPPEWKFAVNAKTDINVDVRCQGGFAVLPPTMHATGNAYVWEAGYAPWEIDIAMAPDWLLAEVEKLIKEHGGVSANTGGNGQTDRISPSQGGQFDAFGHQIDGRETKMRDLVWGAVVDWRRECPIKPSEIESKAWAADKYQVYEQDVSPQSVHPNGTNKTDALEAEGRGPTEFWKKWSHAMNQWDTKVAEEARKPGKPYGENYTKTRDGFLHTPPAGQSLPYPTLTIDDIMDRPDPVWAIEGLVSERTLGFIYGPPSSLKTFIAIDIALSIVTGAAAWWGRPIKTTGAVVYLCREGTRSLKFRIRAWEMHRKAVARGMHFRLVEHPTNFMIQADVDRVIATIKVVAEETGVPIAALFVDTVSRVLPGAEENLQRDMTLFTGACEQIQLAFDCLVIGVHHTNKNGGIRGSTVIPGAGDFLLGAKRETGQMTGSIFVEKVKDGTDGYEIPFKATKIEGLGGIVPQSSLVVDGIDPSAAGPADRYEGGSSDGAKRRDILQALHEAWEAGKPWKVKEAVEIVTVRWRMKEKEARQLLLDWRGYQVIEYTVYNTNTKASGYRKCKDI